MYGFSHDESGQLHRELLDALWRYAYPLVVETVFLTLHAVLTGYFIWRRCKTRKTTVHVDYMLFVTLTMFCLLSAYWAIDDYKLLESVKGITNTSAENLGLEPVLSGDKVSRLELVQQALACPILLIGDYVVLWRAYVIFGRPRWLCISTVIIAVSYSAAYIALVACRFQVYGRLMNVVPNFIATVLVTYKAWIHWKEIRTFAHEGGTRHSLALLLVILESGFAYTALTIAYGLVVFLNSNGMAANWFAYILTPLLAMYPTLVIVLVSTRKNLLERSIETASSRDLCWNVYVPSSKNYGEGRKRNRCTACRQVGGTSSLGSISELSARFDLSMESQNASLNSKNEDAGRLTPRVLQARSNSSDHTRSEDGPVTSVPCMSHPSRSRV